MFVSDGQKERWRMAGSYGHAQSNEGTEMMLSNRSREDIYTGKKTFHYEADNDLLNSQNSSKTDK